MRCPEQAAVRRSAGEVGTGLGAHGAPRPCPPAPTLSERVREGEPRRPVPGPSGRGRSVVGGASAGRPRAAPQGKGLGGDAKRPSSSGGAIIASGCSVGRALRRPGVTRVWPACSAVGGPAPHGRRFAHGRRRGPAREGPSQQRAHVGTFRAKSGPCTRGLAGWRNGGWVHRQLQVPQICLMTLPGVIAAMIRSVPC